MKRTVFLTGGTSLFGSAFLVSIPKNTKVIVAEHKLKNQTNNSNIKTYKINDLSINELTNVISKYNPSVIVHAASISDVDYCQKHTKEAWKTNVLGTKNLLQVSQNKNIHFIYLSTNAVFDGKKEVYKEKDIPNPLNYYGNTKYIGELLTQKYSDCWTIVRPITMYGWEPNKSRKNPVTWVIENLKNGKKLKIVDDVILNPLFNLDLGKLIWKIIEKRSQGIYHIAGSQTLNRYQWAQKTAQIFGLDDRLISPVPSSYFFNKIATRPHRTVYSVDKIKKTFNFKPKSVVEGLKIMKSTQNN